LVTRRSRRSDRRRIGWCSPRPLRDSHTGPSGSVAYPLPPPLRRAHRPVRRVTSVGCEPASASTSTPPPCPLTSSPAGDRTRCRPVRGVRVRRGHGGRVSAISAWQDESSLTAPRDHEWDPPQVAGGRPGAVRGPGGGALPLPLTGAFSGTRAGRSSPRRPAATEASSSPLACLAGSTPWVMACLIVASMKGGWSISPFFSPFSWASVAVKVA